MRGNRTEGQDFVNWFFIRLELEHSFMLSCWVFFIYHILAGLALKRAKVFGNFVCYLFFLLQSESPSRSFRQKKPSREVGLDGDLTPERASSVWTNVSGRLGPIVRPASAAARTAPRPCWGLSGRPLQVAGACPTTLASTCRAARARRWASASAAEPGSPQLPGCWSDPTFGAGSFEQRPETK